MKCPYPKCQKDYNDAWPTVFNGFVNPIDFSASNIDRKFFDRVYLVTRHCRFCLQYFHEVHVGHENFEVDKFSRTKWLTPTLDFLISFPSSKTRFEASGVPKDIRDYFNEAERCRSVGSLTGTGACLRKTVYALCDDKMAEGADYREKISNLPVKDAYKELLTQIKWLGDNTTKPGGEGYAKEILDQALEILPFIIDELYFKDDQVEKAIKLLSKTRSQNPK